MALSYKEKIDHEYQVLDTVIKASESVVRQQQQIIYNLIQEYQEVCTHTDVSGGRYDPNSYRTGRVCNECGKLLEMKNEDTIHS